MRDVVGDIDRASTKVVAQLADPQVFNLKKKGLVLGYVQSGKTANFTAVMAKAADAGYKLFIVLSGLHNNLRQQTQVRLEKDLGQDWHYLTTPDKDFGGSSRGSALLGRGAIPVIAVIKKNKHRLAAMIEWLESVPEDIRQRTPVLILDDEADQATPNSAAQADQLTKINELVRKLWSVTKTGTYVGYTATPFANVFMDPNDEEELYPEDFIADLPRPDSYYGAERIFGRESLAEGDTPYDGLDMIRTVPDDDATELKPPSSKASRDAFDPDLPDSLKDAVLWFLVATAVRHSRGHDRAHSSMLVHTTHYTSPHFQLKDRIGEFISEITDRATTGDYVLLRASFEREAHRVPNESTFPPPKWDDIAPHIRGVLQTVRVVVDNGYSEDRLTYSDEVETVIAIGGGTLSRGLTLEGLVVSYFIRTSNTYDTLLQMGRWFGYRVGYEDLPRMWMQASLRDDFSFLAMVEEEIRRSMEDLERSGCTPRQFGVRVRSHPGRLEIVARNKMRHASIERVSFSGERLQTFIFDERDMPMSNGGQGQISHNLTASRAFVATLSARREFERIDQGSRWICRGVDPQIIANFVDQYAFHSDQTNLRHEYISGWIRENSEGRLWNVVIAGRSREDKRSVEIGLATRIGVVNRAPMKDDSRPTRANIKSLLSHNDWFADLDPADLSSLTQDERANPRGVRRRLADGRGLLILMPVDKDSAPIRYEKDGGSRRKMNAPVHIIGLGLVFPDIDRKGYAAEGSYYSVKPDWEPTPPEDEDDFFEDSEDSTTEADFEVL